VIRRSATFDGRTSWVLLSQREHARVAGELAQHWGLDPLPVAEVLVPTLFRHDDGWEEWDRRPDVDCRAGWPIAFDEMRPSDSIPIWRQSVDSVADLGPLATWLVSGHFAALLRRSDHRTTRDDTSATDTDRFLEDFDRRGPTLLEAWTTQREELADASRAAYLALEYLQWFDALSLWLCCAERSEATTMIDPLGREIRLIPEQSDQVAIVPWPMNGPSLTITAVGLKLPAKHYESTIDMLTAVSGKATISWQLRPASP